MYEIVSDRTLEYCPSPHGSPRVDVALDLHWDGFLPGWEDDGCPHPDSDDLEWDGYFPAFQYNVKTKYTCGKGRVRHCTSHVSDVSFKTADSTSTSYLSILDDGRSYRSSRSYVRENAAILRARARALLKVDTELSILTHRTRKLLCEQEKRSGDVEIDEAKGSEKCGDWLNTDGHHLITTQHTSFECCSPGYQHQLENNFRMKNINRDVDARQKREDHNCSILDDSSCRHDAEESEEQGCAFINDKIVSRGSVKTSPYVEGHTKTVSKFHHCLSFGKCKCSSTKQTFTPQHKSSRLIQKSRSSLCSNVSDEFYTAKESVSKQEHSDSPSNKKHEKLMTYGKCFPKYESGNSPFIEFQVRKSVSFSDQMLNRKHNVSIGEEVFFSPNLSHSESFVASKDTSIFFSPCNSLQYSPAVDNLSSVSLDILKDLEIDDDDTELTNDKFLKDSRIYSGKHSLSLGPFDPTYREPRSSRSSPDSFSDGPLSDQSFRTCSTCSCLYVDDVNNDLLLDRNTCRQIEQCSERMDYIYHIAPVDVCADDLWASIAPTEDGPSDIEQIVAAYRHCDAVYRMSAEGIEFAPGDNPQCDANYVHTHSVRADMVGFGRGDSPFIEPSQMNVSFELLCEPPHTETYTRGRRFQVSRDIQLFENDAQDRQGQIKTQENDGHDDEIRDVEDEEPDKRKEKYVAVRRELEEIKDHGKGTKVEDEECHTNQSVKKNQQDNEEDGEADGNVTRISMYGNAEIQDDDQYDENLDNKGGKLDVTSVKEHSPILNTKISSLTVVEDLMVSEQNSFKCSQIFIVDPVLNTCDDDTLDKHMMFKCPEITAAKGYSAEMADIHKPDQCSVHRSTQSDADVLAAHQVQVRFETPTQRHESGYASDFTLCTSLTSSTINEPEDQSAMTPFFQDAIKVAVTKEVEAVCDPKFHCSEEMNESDDIADTEVLDWDQKSFQSDVTSVNTDIVSFSENSLSSTMFASPEVFEIDFEETDISPEKKKSYIATEVTDEENHLERITAMEDNCKFHCSEETNSYNEHSEVQEYSSDFKESRVDGICDINATTFDTVEDSIGNPYRCPENFTGDIEDIIIGTDEAETFTADEKGHSAEFGDNKLSDQDISQLLQYADVIQWEYEDDIEIVIADPPVCYAAEELYKDNEPTKRYDVIIPKQQDSCIRVFQTTSSVPEEVADRQIIDSELTNISCIVTCSWDEGIVVIVSNFQEETATEAQESTTTPGEVTHLFCPEQTMTLSIDDHFQVMDELCSETAKASLVQPSSTEISRVDASFHYTPEVHYSSYEDDNIVSDIETIDYISCVWTLAPEYKRKATVNDRKPMCCEEHQEQRGWEMMNRIPDVEPRIIEPINVTHIHFQEAHESSPYVRNDTVVSQQQQHAKENKLTSAYSSLSQIDTIQNYIGVIHRKDYPRVTLSESYLPTAVMGLANITDYSDEKHMINPDAKRDTQRVGESMSLPSFHSISWKMLQVNEHFEKLLETDTKISMDELKGEDTNREVQYILERKDSDQEWFDAVSESDNEDYFLAAEEFEQEPGGVVVDQIITKSDEAVMMSQCQENNEAGEITVEKMTTKSGEMVMSLISEDEEKTFEHDTKETTVANSGEVVSYLISEDRKRTMVKNVTYSIEETLGIAYESVLDVDEVESFEVSQGEYRVEDLIHTKHQFSAIEQILTSSESCEVQDIERYEVEQFFLPYTIPDTMKRDKKGISVFNTTTQHVEEIVETTNTIPEEEYCCTTERGSETEVAAHNLVRSSHKEQSVLPFTLPRIENLAGKIMSIFSATEKTVDPNAETTLLMDQEKSSKVNMMMNQIECGFEKQRNLVSWDEVRLESLVTESCQSLHEYETIGDFIEVLPESFSLSPVVLPQVADSKANISFAANHEVPENLVLEENTQKLDYLEEYSLSPVVLPQVADSKANISFAANHEVPENLVLEENIQKLDYLEEYFSGTDYVSTVREHFALATEEQQFTPKIAEQIEHKSEAIPFPDPGAVAREMSISRSFEGGKIYLDTNKTSRWDSWDKISTKRKLSFNVKDLKTVLFGTEQLDPQEINVPNLPITDNTATQTSLQAFCAEKSQNTSQVDLMNKAIQTSKTLMLQSIQDFQTQTDHSAEIIADKLRKRLRETEPSTKLRLENISPRNTASWRVSILSPSQQYKMTPSTYQHCIRETQLVPWMDTSEVHSEIHKTFECEQHIKQSWGATTSSWLLQHEESEDPDSRMYTAQAEIHDAEYGHQILTNEENAKSLGVSYSSWLLSENLPLKNSRVEVRRSKSCNHHDQDFHIYVKVPYCTGLHDNTHLERTEKFARVRPVKSGRKGNCLFFTTHQENYTTCAKNTLEIDIRGTVCNRIFHSGHTSRSKLPPLYGGTIPAHLRNSIYLWVDRYNNDDVTFTRVSKSTFDTMRKSRSFHL